MATVANLITDMSVNSTKFMTGLQKADRAMASSQAIWNKHLFVAEKGFANLNNKVSMAAKGFISFNGVLGTLLGGAGLIAVTKSAIDAAGAIADTAVRLGMSTDALQEYQHAAQMSGISTEEFEAAIIKLNTGIAQGKVGYKDTDSALMSIADKIAKTSDQSKRASIVFDAFGKSGAKLLPLFQDGAEGLTKMRNEAQQLGLVMNAGTIQAAEKLGDQLDSMFAALRVNFQSGLLAGLVGDTENLGKAFSDPAFIAGLQTFGNFVGKTLGFLIENGPTITKIMAAIGGFWAASKTTTIAVSAVAGPEVGVPVGFGAGLAGAGIAWHEASKKIDEDTVTTKDKVAELQDGVKKLHRTMGESVDDKSMESLKKAVDEAKFELLLLDKNLTDSGKRVYQAMHAAGLDPLKSMPPEIRATTTELAGLYGKIEETKKAEQDAIDLSKTAVNQYVKNATDVVSSAQEATASMFKGMEDALLSFVRTGKMNFNDFANSIIDDLIRIAIQTQITGPLASSIGTSISTGIASLFGGARANGGSVMAGQAYLVGERGPEIFSPTGSGTIIPNHNIGSNGMVVNISNNTPSQVSAQGGNNGASLDIMIDSSVARNLASRGSASNRSIRSNFGASEVLASR